MNGRELLLLSLYGSAFYWRSRSNDGGTGDATGVLCRLAHQRAPCYCESARLAAGIIIGARIRNNAGIIGEYAEKYVELQLCLRRAPHLEG